LSVIWLTRNHQIGQPALKASSSNWLLPQSHRDSARVGTPTCFRGRRLGRIPRKPGAIVAQIGPIMARKRQGLKHRGGISMTLQVSRRIMLAAPFLAAPGTVTELAAAAEGGFYAFLVGVRRDATSRGIRVSTVDLAFRKAQFLPHVIELDRKQPERTMTFSQYIAKVVTPQRKEDARNQLAENRLLLDDIWRRYGVEPSIIVALWGLESDFGRLPGNIPTISALATLTYDGRRGAYFRSELMAALRILDRGDIGVEEMTGSWAGAMGGPQFMPSSYLEYAVDYDGDGRRDIWNSRGDVLASIANYIRGLGWRGGQSWGQDVLLPN